MYTYIEKNIHIYRYLLHQKKMYYFISFYLTRDSSNIVFIYLPCQNILNESFLLKYCNIWLQYICTIPVPYNILS